MNRGLFCATLVVLGIMLAGCIHLGYMPSREIATIPAGTQEQLTFKVDLPKSSASWEIGLWPTGGGTNIAELAGKHVFVQLANVSDRELTLSAGVSSAFKWMPTVPPGQSLVVFDAPIKSYAQMTRLFGCNAQEHGVSFLLTLEFRPTVHLERPITVVARGRDAL